MYDVIIERTADDYRGSLSCWKITYPAGIRREKNEELSRDGFPYVEDLYIGAKVVGTLSTYYGNSGRSSSVAAQEISFRKGIKVKRNCV